MSPTDERQRYRTALWCATALNQAERFERSVDRFNNALEETRWQRLMAVTDSPHRAEWEAQHAANPEQVEPLMFGDTWQLLGERYFLVLALGQVRKCVHLLRADRLPRMTDPRIVKLLRDIEEHWEQDVTSPQALSLREIREREPKFEPGRVVIGKRGTWLSEGVTVDDLTEWVADVDTKVRAKASAAGQALPAATDLVRT